MKPTASNDRQIRLTYEDTINTQEKLRTFVWTKFKKNDFVHMGEESEYLKLLHKAFRSQGNWRIAYYVHGNMKIPLNPVHSFAMRLCFVYSPRLSIERYDVVLEIDIKEMWSILLEEMFFIFPAALEEALKISGEVFMGEERESFEWKHEKGFKNDG